MRSNLLDDIASILAENEDLKRRLIRAVSEPSNNWWDKNLPARLSDYAGWLGTPDMPSRIKVRSIFRERKYGSMLDCGCGLAVELQGFINDGCRVSYTGIDACKWVVERNEKEFSGKGTFVHWRVDVLPWSEPVFDVVYIREVLEHLPSYQKTLSDAYRATKHEVMVVFFIKPTSAPDDIKVSECDGCELFHNHWNKESLEAFVVSLGGVFEWVDLDEKRNLMRIRKGAI